MEVLHRSRFAIAIAESIKGESLLVPAHFDAEVLSALVSAVRLRRFTLDAARAALARLILLPAQRTAVTPLLGEAFALRERCSPADALYVILARHARARLVTLDRRLARAVHGLVDVTLISES